MSAERSVRAAPERASERHRALVEELDVAARELGVLSPEQAIEGELAIRDLRRKRRRAAEDPLGMLTLTEVDGVLLWSEGAAGPPALAGRRRRRAAVSGAPEGEVVAQYRFPRLGANQVSSFLEDLDRKLTPHQGLRVWRDGMLKPVERPAASMQRALLFVHGTFSSNDHMLEELTSTEHGRAFLERAAKHYDGIYAFDHPTLSVSPTINAFELSRSFADVRAQVDVVAHSRGGLVARWWLEGFGGAGVGPRRAALVGSPLGGTSLASPARLRASMSMLTNIGSALRIAGAGASSVAPFLSVPVAILRVVTSITSFAAKTPAFDAAIAMVPGLACQSRVRNNAEIAALRRARVSPRPEYFAVISDFEPEDVRWRFWQRFRKTSLADGAADWLFDGQNDLVVDTPSMTELSETPFPADRLLDFATNPRVHHVNYFRQEETLAHLAKWFAMN